MSAESQTQPLQKARETDPNVLQRRASDPQSSVWVSASAGTGKTKVLTDRVLRLLLPRDDGRDGTAAHKILCLTFTKAAASEMALRISKTLAKWAVLPSHNGKETLFDELKNLLGRDPKPEEMTTARKLFADVVDVPGGLKIMTIHAFCQSILGRFPLEAGLNPQFIVLDDSQSLTLMNQARENVLARLNNKETSPEASALNTIAATINEDQFLQLMNAIARERAQLKRLLKKYFDVDGLYTAICQHLAITPNQSTFEILKQASGNDAFNHSALKNAALYMMDTGSKTDKEKADKILTWLALTQDERVQNFKPYASAFLTGENTIRASMATKKICEADPSIPDTMTQEAERILNILDTVNAAQSAMLTRNVLRLGSAILDEYTALKTQQNGLDYDDLILNTLALLKGESMNLEHAGRWVHYKLDQGLDHILIDEAQDTNPEQWQIIDALCDEFFHGESTHQDTTRSVFTVGDEKQSIYSFQRASPEAFDDMRKHFKTRIQDAQQGWDEVPMNISFRSTKSVLQTVDAVFSNPLARKGLGHLPIEHTAYRRGQAGLCEIWPLFESDETEKPDLWTPLKEPDEALTAQKKLSLHIAKTIKDWVNNKEELPSQNRSIKPGDIMILVRTRSVLVNQIARELKNENIPVSGLDRMILNEELVIQDLLAMAEFALQPLDDLSLACFLKSPLIGLDENTLFEWAAHRGQHSLWAAVKENAPEDVVQYLSALITASKTGSPYAFFKQTLQSPCPTDEISARRAIMGRLGKDAFDPLDEFLNQARAFEHNETPSLQHFIRIQKSQSTAIKREHDPDKTSQTGEVRIITVHGSKGLQAPIVILPDTLSGPNSGPSKPEKRLLWPNQSNLDIPLWSPRKDMDYTAYQDAMAVLDERLNEEHRRLLYVAMTRAEDRLYIGGALGKRKKAESIQPDSWYALIQNGLKTISGHEKTPSGGLKITNPQTKDADKNKNQKTQQDCDDDIPAWLTQSVPDEPPQPRIFRPSHIADTALSPLEQEGTHRFVRGNLTHKLLQVLPNTPKDNWHNAISKFLERYGNTLAEDIREDIANETLNVLENPDFAPLFEKGSMAEVPITGYLQDRGLISGQIDRLRITEHSVLFIDYKTNRPPPKDASSIPAAYNEQMATYAGLLKQLYPDKAIKGALLWTDGPFLMPLDL